MDDFVVAFNNADVLFLLDIYAASEQPIEGITAEVLTENIKKYRPQERRRILVTSKPRPKRFAACFNPVIW